MFKKHGHSLNIYTMDSCTHGVDIVEGKGEIMDKVKLVQDIGNEVCEGCGPDADCGEDPEECPRIQGAIRILNRELCAICSND